MFHPPAAAQKAPNRPENLRQAVANHPSDNPTASEIREALTIAARFIDRDGDPADFPIFARLEAEVAKLDQVDSIRARAARLAGVAA